MPTISSLVAPVARPYKQSFSMDPDPTNPAVHVIDLSWAARLYKLVFQAGHYSMATKTIDVVPGFEAYSLAFAEAFWKAVEDAGTVVDVACGGGAFVMVELIERLRAGESPLLAEVKKTFAAPAARKRAEESKAKGSKLFLEKLNSL
jgi:pumilio family protein 6